MRTALLVAALGLASTALAQIPIPTFGSTYTAAQTRGFYFQAPTSFTITGLSCPNESAQPFQVFEVIDFGAVPPPTWPTVGTGTQLFYDNASAGGSILSTAIPITAGNYIGILGACTATVGGTTSYNSYASTAGAFTSSILGNPVTLTRFGTQFGIGGGGNNPCWTEPLATISRVEVYVGGLSGYALAQPYGTGCNNAPDVSSYELFATASAFDLANTGISLIHTGGGYLALPGVTTWVPPSATAQVLALGDDTETTVTLSQAMPVAASGTTTSLTVCSNGYVSAASGNGTGYTPGGAALLNAPQMCWSLYWHDLNPSIAASGTVKFEEVGGIAYITWDGVWDYGGTTAANANSFQAQFDLATGTVHFVYGAMSGLGNAAMTGVSDAGASADPGSMDISAALPATYTAAQFRVVPLAHAASARPVIGTSINLNATQAPAGALLGVLVLGTTEHTNGIDLTFLGMPGCNLYASLDATVGFLYTAGAGSIPLSIPANNALAGAVILTQMAA
ncbi:MAG: hypothetical protein JNK15_17250 [Planctomycetes bacterium]|nr:hypothetical protein [Planctomycetota bacterium]